MSNVPTKKFRASVDDASFEVEVTGDVVRVHSADAVSGQSGSNLPKRQQGTPPSSKNQPVGPPATATGNRTASDVDAAGGTLDGTQFIVTPRGQAVDVRQIPGGAPESASGAAHVTGAHAPNAGAAHGLLDVAVSADDPPAAQSRESVEVTGTPAARAFVATAGDVTWVSIDGEVFAIDIEDAQRTRKPRAASGEGLSAPMPATVIKVIAEPGREVKRGETLLLLEAMKMELPVRAPRDGKVKALHCQAGQLVQPGVPLVDLE